jgi:hypothetical protein
MIAQIEIEGTILKQEGNKIICKVEKIGTLNVVAHIWITKGQTVKHFEGNPAINSKAGLGVGRNGRLQLY